MSKIYEALQKAQEEREGVPPLESERSQRRSWFRSRKTSGGNGHRAHAKGALRIDFDLAPDVERRAILGGAAPALPGRAGLVDLADWTGEHAGEVVLVGVGRGVALARGRIAGHLVALVQR